jgi:RNA polymerase sigma-70 factor (ECF subfamily)
MTPTEPLPGDPDLNTLLPEFMRRYQAADPAAADALVAILNPILARYYYALTGDASLVEDLLQDCWLRILRARHSYRPGEPVLPWAFAIARHTRVDSYRRWQRSSGRESNIDDIPSHPSSDPRLALESRLQAGAIFAALQSLPEGQREVLMMLKVSDMTVDEVALATGSTAAAVKQKAYRAYQAVRRILGLQHKEGSDELR